jgi:hypothetical protein
MNLYPVKWYIEEHNPITILLDRYYEQRYATEKISGFANNLSDFMVTLEHCPKSNEFIQKLKDEVDLYWGEIDMCVELSNKRKIKRSALFDELWDFPLGEYDSYLLNYNGTTLLRCFNEDNHHKGALISIEKEGVQLSPPSEAAWLELKRKYAKAIKMIEAGATPRYDELLN